MGSILKILKCWAFMGPEGGLPPKKINTLKRVCPCRSCIQRLHYPALRHFWYEISSVVFPITLYLRGHHKKFQPSRLSEMPPSGGPYHQKAASKWNTWKIRLWPFLGSWALNKKNKDTFFSSTFKVSESKASLLFWFVAQELRYWQFLPLTIA